MDIWILSVLFLVSDTRHPNVDAAAEMLLTEVPEEAAEMQPAEEPPNKRPRVEE